MLPYNVAIIVMWDYLFYLNVSIYNSSFSYQIYARRKRVVSYSAFLFLSSHSLFPAEMRSQHSLAMQDDAWDADWDLYKNLYKKWTELKETSGHK